MFYLLVSPAPRPTVSALSATGGRVGETSRFGKMLIILHPKREGEGEAVRFTSDPPTDGRITDGTVLLLLLLFAIATLHRDYRLIASLPLLRPFPPSLARCLSLSVGFLKLYSNGSVPGRPRSAPTELFSVWHESGRSFGRICVSSHRDKL